jgi:hypothetical protein
MDNAPLVNNHFEDASDKAFYEKNRQELELIKQEESLIISGSMDESHATRMVNNTRVEAKTTGSNGRSSKKRDYLFYAMLDDMDERITELQQQISELYNDLKVKYGDDAIGGMAATFLPPDVLDKLTTDEDKMKALADEFLNDDGSIKDKYKDLPEAQYIQKLRELEEVMNAEPKVQAESMESSHASSESSFTSSSFNFGKSM